MWLLIVTAIIISILQFKLKLGIVTKKDTQFLVMTYNKDKTSFTNFIILLNINYVKKFVKTKNKSAS